MESHPLLLLPSRWSHFVSYARIIVDLICSVVLEGGRKSHVFWFEKWLMLKKYGQIIFGKDLWIFIFLHIDGKDVFVNVFHIGNNRIEVYCFEDLLSFGSAIVQKIKDVFLFILIFLFFARFLADLLGLLLLLKFHTFELKFPRRNISTYALSGGTHEKSRSESLGNCILAWVWVRVQSERKVLGVLAILVRYQWKSWLF